MTAVFIGMIVFFLLTFFAINLNFLEPYYISNKETQFIRMYGQLIVLRHTEHLAVFLRLIKEIAHQLVSEQPHIMDVRHHTLRQSGGWDTNSR